MACLSMPMESTTFITNVHTYESPSFHSRLSIPKPHIQIILLGSLPEINIGATLPLRIYTTGKTSLSQFTPVQQEKQSSRALQSSM